MSVLQEGRNAPRALKARVAAHAFVWLALACWAGVLHVNRAVSLLFVQRQQAWSVADNAVERLAIHSVSAMAEIQAALDAECGRAESAGQPSLKGRCEVRDGRRHLCFLDAEERIIVEVAIPGAGSVQ